MATATMVDKLNREVRNALAAPDLRQRFSGDGAEAADTSPEQLRKYPAAEIVKWRSVVRKARVRVE